MNRINKLRIFLLSRYLLPLILILQLFLAGFGLNLPSDKDLTLSINSQESSPLLTVCFDDVEDKIIDSSTILFIVFGFDDSKLFSKNTLSSNDFKSRQNHSRSPPTI
jgi:hypothetical protein